MWTRGIPIKNETSNILPVIEKRLVKFLVHSICFLRENCINFTKFRWVTLQRMHNLKNLCHAFIWFRFLFYFLKFYITSQMINKPTELFTHSYDLSNYRNKKTIYLTRSFKMLFISPADIIVLSADVKHFDCILLFIRSRLLAVRLLFEHGSCLSFFFFLFLFYFYTGWQWEQLKDCCRRYHFQGYVLNNGMNGLDKKKTK